MLSVLGRADKILAQAPQKRKVNVKGIIAGELNRQKSLYLYDLLWEDTQKWLEDIRGHPLAKQIIGSADSICANIEEGFGRGYGKQLIQFYVYSLGSARETKGRLYRARAFYTLETLQKRLTLASEVVALILTEINRQKHR